MGSLFSSINKFKKRTAIIDNKQNVHTYENLLSDAQKFKKFFKKKNLILVVADNTYEFIVFYVAALLNNQTLIILNSDITNEDVKILVKSYYPKFIFCNKEYKRIKNFNKIYDFDDFSLYNSKNLKIKYPINKNLSILISTSGTSGRNKYVKLSNENIMQNTNSIIKMLKISKEDKIITTMSPSYSYALSIINTNLVSGAQIILNNYSLIDKNFWIIYNKHQPNNFNGVPYIYEILEKIGLNRLNFKKLKYLTQAGGALSEDIKKKIIKLCDKHKTKFFIMYGQAEAAPRISILPHNLLKKNLSSVGLPVLGGKVWIEDKVFNKESKLYEGELVYKGKNVFMGYSSSFKDLKKDEPKNNLLKTGDIGYVDKKKLIFITGRKKRIVKIFGIRISLDQLDQELKKKNFNCTCSGDDKKIIVNFESIKNIDIQKFHKVFKSITKLLPRFYELKEIGKFKRTVSGKIIH